MSFHVVEHLVDPLKVMRALAGMLSPNGVMLLHVPVDDQELGNFDHLHFFTDASCRRLMEQVTQEVRSDFSRYAVPAGKAAMAATYVGRKKIRP